MDDFLISGSKDLFVNREDFLLDPRDGIRIDGSQDQPEERPDPGAVLDPIADSPGGGSRFQNFSIMDPIEDSPGGGNKKKDRTIEQSFTEHKAADINGSGSQASTQAGSQARQSGGLQIAGFNVGTGGVLFALAAIFLIFNFLQKR